MKVTQELLMSRKCKVKLRMMMTMVEGDDDNDDNDDESGNSIDDESNFVDGVTANGDVSNTKHLIGETRCCFLKHKTLQVDEE